MTGKAALEMFAPGEYDWSYRDIPQLPDMTGLISPENWNRRHTREDFTAAGSAYG